MFGIRLDTLSITLCGSGLRFVASCVPLVPPLKEGS